MNANLNVADDIADRFKDVKMRRKNQWIAIGIENDVNLKVLEEGDAKIDGATAWAQMRERTGQSARILILDYNNKLYFIYKCFDTLPVKEKMTMAAAKTQIRNMFDGVKDYECHEDDEFTEAAFKKRI